MYELFYAEGWDEHFKQMNNSTQQIIMKKILKLKEQTKLRHLKCGAPYFVEEISQYRICFREESNWRRITFVGTHKQYKKWYKQFF